MLFTLLGRVALLAQRPIVVKLSRGRYVGLYVRTYVRPSVCSVHCGKTADRIRMTFGIVGRTGPGMRQVVGFEDRSTGRGILGDEFGARYCNQWGLCGVRVRQRRDAALFPNYFGQTCCGCCCCWQPVCRIYDVVVGGVLAFRCTNITRQRFTS